MTIRERIRGGEHYRFDDHSELIDAVRRAQALLERFNGTPFAERAERDRLLRELLADVGEGRRSGRRFTATTATGSALAIGPSSTSTR